MQIVAVTDPLQLGFRRQAMIGMQADGDMVTVADALAAMPEVDYVVITAGSFDLLAEVVCEDDDHLLELLNQQIRALPGRPQHRDVRLPEAAQADLHLGDPMTRHDVDARAAPTRARRPPATTSGCTSPGCRPTDGAGPDHRARRGLPTSGTPTGSTYLDGLAGLFVVQAGHGRRELAEAAAKQAERAGLLPALVLRAPARRSSWPTGWPPTRPAT